VGSTAEIGKEAGKGSKGKTQEDETTHRGGTMGKRDWLGLRGNIKLKGKKRSGKKQEDE